MRRPDARSQRGFRPLEHTADRSIEAWGASLPDLFCAAAEGMFSASAHCSPVTPQQQWSVEVEADSLEDLLHAWLSELLWLSERDAAALCTFEMVQVERTESGLWRARGLARGGPFSEDSPHTGAPVKAVTYHDLRIWQDGDTWRAHLVFDV